MTTHPQGNKGSLCAANKQGLFRARDAFWMRAAQLTRHYALQLTSHRHTAGKQSPSPHFGQATIPAALWGNVRSCHNGGETATCAALVQINNPCDMVRTQPSLVLEKQPTLLGLIDLYGLENAWVGLHEGLEGGGGGGRQGVVP